MGRAVTASSSPRCSVASDARAWLFLALGSGRRFLGPARNALHTFSAHRFSPAACRRGVCMHRGNSPFTSHPQACRLTGRSSGQPPARHLARQALTVIIRLAGQAPSRRLPLSSNVRPHTNSLAASCSSASLQSFPALTVGVQLDRCAPNKSREELLSGLVTSRLCFFLPWVVAQRCLARRALGSGIWALH